MKRTISVSIYRYCEDCEGIVDLFHYAINEIDKAVNKIIEAIFDDDVKKVKVTYPRRGELYTIAEINIEEDRITINPQLLTHETLKHVLKKILSNLPI